MKTKTTKTPIPKLKFTVLVADSRKSFKEGKYITWDEYKKQHETQS